MSLSFLSSSHVIRNIRARNFYRNALPTLNYNNLSILPNAFITRFTSNLQNHKKNHQNPTKFVFNKEQQYVLDLVVNQRKSIFLTGAAGTGKTVLLKEIIRLLKRKYESYRNFDHLKNRILVTATTGLAAYHIGGRTYHSTLGIMDILKQKSKNKNTKLKLRYESVWRNCEVLIIDEVSMMESSTLDLIDSIAKEVRGSIEPFGGIQVILSGDFFQLPPVNKSNIKDIVDKYDAEEEQINPLLMKKTTKEKTSIDFDADYAFNSNIWSKAFQHCLSLSTVYRQLEDPEFVECLNEIRLGVMSSKTQTIMNEVSKKTSQLSRESVTLFATRNEANLHNKNIVDNMEGPSITYNACYGGKLKGTDDFKEINNSIMLSDSLSLKVGSLVMITRNIDKTLYNGTTGTIVGFVKDKSGHANENLSYGDQVTRDFNVDDSIAYETDFQQKGSDHSQITFDLSDVNNQAVMRYENPDNKILDHSERLYPVFEYYNSKLSKYRRRILMPSTIVTSTSKNGTVLHWKTQLPLISAWGLTIHKSQGQTYKSLICDFERFFAVGQVYVALSRVKSRAGLFLQNWDPKKIICDKKVIDFHQNCVKDLKVLVNQK